MAPVTKYRGLRHYSSKIPRHGQNLERTWRDHRFFVTQTPYRNRLFGIACCTSLACRVITVSCFEGSVARPRMGPVRLSLKYNRLLASQVFGKNTTGRAPSNIWTTRTQLKSPRCTCLPMPSNLAHGRPHTIDRAYDAEGFIAICFLYDEK